MVCGQLKAFSSDCEFMKDRNREEDNLNKCKKHSDKMHQIILQSLGPTSKGLEAMHRPTLCFLRECRACLMVSYSSPCSASVMDRQESVFNLSSFIAAQSKEVQSKGVDRACLA